MPSEYATTQRILSAEIHTQVAKRSICFGEWTSGKGLLDGSVFHEDRYGIVAERRIPPTANPPYGLAEKAS